MSDNLNYWHVVVNYRGTFCWVLVVNHKVVYVSDEYPTRDDARAAARAAFRERDAATGKIEGM